MPFVVVAPVTFNAPPTAVLPVVFKVVVVIAPVLVMPFVVVAPVTTTVSDIVPNTIWF